MTAAEWMLALSLLGGLQGIHYQERGAVLVTSARMKEVGHGWIEHYYPEVLFYHHKNETPNGSGKGSKGYFSLLGSDSPDQRLAAKFSGNDSKFSYTFLTEKLMDALRPDAGIPPNYFTVSEQNSLVEEVSLSAANNLEDPLSDNARKVLNLLAVQAEVRFEKPTAQTPAQTQGQTPHEIRTLTFTSARQAYLVQIGSKANISKLHDALMRGTGDAGDPEAGRVLHGSVFQTQRLQIEIESASPQQSAQATKDAMPGTDGKHSVGGWHLGAVLQQKSGYLFLPGFDVAPSGGASPVAEKARNERQELGELIYVPIIDRSADGKFNTIEISAADFIEYVFKKTTGVRSKVECYIAENGNSESACRRIAIDEKDPSKTEQRIYLHLAGDPGTHKALNSFTLWDPVNENKYQNVQIFASADKTPIRSRSEGVYPVRVRTKAAVGAKGLK